MWGPEAEVVESASRPEARLGGELVLKDSAAWLSLLGRSAEGSLLERRVCSTAIDMALFVLVEKTVRAALLFDWED